MKLLYFFLLLSIASAAGLAPAAQPVATDESVAQKALQVLDGLFGRIDAFITRVDEPTFKAQAQASFAELKKRRDALRADFSTSTYEDLRFDAMIDHHRLAGWLSEPKEKPLPARDTAASRANRPGADTGK